MAKFKVQITEKLNRTVLVEAENLCDAEVMVEAAYNKEEIVLDYKDYVGVEFLGDEIDLYEYEMFSEAGREIIGSEEATEFVES